MNLRCYQQKAKDAVMEAFVDHGTTLIVIPTGGGKTIVAAHIAKEMLAKGRVMVMVHREELLRQAQQKFLRIIGIEPDIEKAEYWSKEDSIHGKPPIVIASVQTLNSGEADKKRLHRFDPAEFSLLWIDEFHHAPAATWLRCLNHFKQNPELRVLGVTATPDRADERGLAEVCDHVAFNYQLNDIISDGYLVPIRQRRVTIKGLEFARIKTVGEDFDQQELEAVMLAEEPLHGIVQATIETACDLEIGFLQTIRDEPDRAEKLSQRLAGRKPKKTLIFTVSVAHAERISEIINRWLPKHAAAISGGTPGDIRQRTLGEFHDGQIQFLCNCAIALEGFDEPGIELVSMARPTKSRTIYAQAAGRGTRPAAIIADQLGELNTAEARRKLIAQSLKPWITLLDFVGNSGKHKLICSADILGVSRPQSVVERAAQMAEDGDVDMVEALAAAEVEDERVQAATALEEEMEAERADASDEECVVAAARRRMVVATASYSVHSVSPFAQHDREPDARHEDRATPNQIEALRQLEISPRTSSAYTRRQAGAVIESLRSKRCSIRQRWALLKSGYLAQEIDRMNFQDAMTALDKAKQEALSQ